MYKVSRSLADGGREDRKAHEMLGNLLAGIQNEIRVEQGNRRLLHKIIN